MRIELVDGGFNEVIKNAVIKEVFCDYNGSCTVHFYEKPPKKLNIGCSSYNRQYGIPVSEDGRTLFISNWETGLFAYDIMSGSVVWHLKDCKITSIVVCQTYVVTQKFGTSIIKLDIGSGEILSEIKSGTIETQFFLNGSYILVNSIKGKLVVVDTDKMTVVKKYNPKVVNPSNSLSILIQNAVLDGNRLSIAGLEDDGQGASLGIINQRAFARVIDTNFISK
jgi:hypothetical protein